MSADMPKMPPQVGWYSKTGHGTFMKESLSVIHQALMHGDRPIWQPLYTAAQMRQFANEATRLAMERCADIADKKAARVNSAWIATDIAHDIRSALSGLNSTTSGGK